MEHPGRHIVTCIKVPHPQYHHFSDHREGGLKGVIEVFNPLSTFPSNCAGKNFHAVTIAA